MMARPWIRLVNPN